MADPIIQTTNLSDTFQALRNRDPLKIQRQTIEEHPDYKRVPRTNYAPIAVVNTGSWGGGGGMTRYAGASTGGTIYGQPGFFSPIHTNINWQIPSKRIEIYQWAYLPHTNVLMEDFTYSEIENTPFNCNNIIEDSITEGFIFETNDYPKIMNSEGIFNQPPRIGMRDCKNKRFFSFRPIGNYRSLKISEEHYIYVLDGEGYRKNREMIQEKKYRSDRGIVSNGVVKVEIREKLIKRIQACDVKSEDYLLTPIPCHGEFSINKDLAWLIGFCVADGCIRSECGGYGVSFTGCKGEPALSCCEEILKNNFDGTVSSRKHGDGNGWRVTIARKTAHEFFRKYIVNKGINKKFSKFIFDLDKESKLNILAGYFDGDGSFSKKEKKLISNCYSRDLSDQIHWLLISCNILGSLGKHALGKNHYSTSSDYSYRIYIPSSQVNSIAPYMRGNKIPSDFIPKKTRDLRFFYTEDNTTYLAQSISKIEEILYTGKCFDIEMTNEKKALVADGYVCSNCRFFYENEPKVGSAIDFYSSYPMSDWEHECRNRKIKVYFDRFKQKLKLNKWCRLISHEVHLLGDCFPLVEIDCPHCGGSGKLGTDICEHEGGTVRRIVILNPDYVEVLTGSVSPEPLIALRPDEELINMVQRKTPGYEKLSMEVIKLISAGQPIRLDNRNVSHLKYGECGYQKYGIGMVKRLFPILSYKTKLMVAQWIVAERLIVPIKIVKVGSDERPAGPADIAAVQAQLASTANDPNLTIVTHHAFDLDWVGASGKILTLSNEFELINQEILDGMMINNALLNGEGPAYSSAAVGIEAMIQRLKTFRQQVSEWLLESIYIPESIRQGFVEKNPETGEDEVVVPKIKWNSMHLRDQQQDKTFAIQLYEKGLLSAQTVLELFDYDPDQEIERKRYDSLQMIALGQGGAGGAGGAGGGMGGMPSLGGMGGGEPPIGGPGGGEMGGPGSPPGAPPSPVGGGVGGPPISKASSISAVEADPGQFGGMVLKKKTRERVERERQRQQQQKQREFLQQQKAQNASSESGINGQMRDEKGRIVKTGLERELIPLLKQAQKDGLLKGVIFQMQYRVTSGEEEYVIDFAVPQLKIGIEADGEVFHSSPKQKQHDDERDLLLAQQGWTIKRFWDKEIENEPQKVVQEIIRIVMQKQLAIQNLSKNKEEQKQG